ncbi:MAG TPA: type I secretion system permease/ATPase [Gammaproteobacteria bacterium]
MVTRTQQLLTGTLAAIRGVFFVVVLFSLCINVLMLAAPIYMMQVFDRVLSSRSTDTLLLLTLIIGVALIAMAGLDAVRGNIMAKVGAWLDKRLAGTVLAGSIAVPLKTGRDPSMQGLRDLHTLRTFLSGHEVLPFLDSPWAPIFLVIVFLLHPTLGYVAVAGAVLLLGLAVVNERVTRALLAASARASGDAIEQAEAAARNADAIEAMGLMPNLVARWARVHAEAVDQQMRASLRSGLISSASKLVRLLLQIGTLGVGALLVIDGELTAGGMIAASILISRALAPVEQSIGAWRAATGARGAYRRLTETLAKLPPRAESMELPAPAGKLSVEGVSYFHPGKAEPTLRNISFALEPGEALGLIGPSASGKTTLARLLLGNLEPRAGHVRLDGMDVAKWNPDDRGRHCGYVPQDIELFSGTVKANIARLAEGDPERIVAAANLVGCHEMILRFTNGYDTPIGEGGSALSGGERQRIALARAVYGDPKLVVLDEANANLDGIGSEALVKALEILKQRKVTVIVVGHRPYVMQHVDKVLVLRNGQMQDFGPKDEVFARLAEHAGGKKVTEIKRHG